jgi:putative Mg2+ transporter-C (MgtC) family protein
MDHHWELFLRIVIGTILGGFIGYERDVHGRPAGLRTHVIVALAASTFMVVSTQFVNFQNYAKGDLVAVDPSRIAASVVSGIGFLGAGAILRTGISVQGLTTAAGLWLVAAIGLCAGAAMYAVSVLVTAVGLGALTVLRRLEDKEDYVGRRRISLVMLEPAAPATTIVSQLEALGAVVAEAECEKELDDGRVSVVFDARVPARLDCQRLLGALEGQPGVRKVRIERVT